MSVMQKLQGINVNSCLTLQGCSQRLYKILWEKQIHGWPIHYEKLGKIIIAEQLITGDSMIFYRLQNFEKLD